MGLNFFFEEFSFENKKPFMRLKGRVLVFLYPNTHRHSSIRQHTLNISSCAFNGPGVQVCLGKSPASESLKGDLKGWGRTEVPPVVQLEKELLLSLFSVVQFFFWVCGQCRSQASFHSFSCESSSSKPVMGERGCRQLRRLKLKSHSS